MIEPLFPLDNFLKGFPEQLANCNTHAEWNEAFRRLFIHMGARLLNDGQPSDQDAALVERINTMLKNGLAAPVPGRPNAAKDGAGYASLFRLFGVETLADGARVLQRTQELEAALQQEQPGTVRTITADAWRKRAKLAERAGYVFRTKDARLGKRRTKLA